MQPDIQKQIEELERKIDEIYVSVEKTRKYFFWTMIITLVVVVLPLIGFMFVIPSFLSNYTDTINTLGGL
jgi:hypothetical protein